MFKSKIPLYTVKETIHPALRLNTKEATHHRVLLPPRINGLTRARAAASIPEHNTAPTLNERLENLPFTRAHGKLLGISGLGWALDAMDVGLISFVMAALIKEWHLSPAEASWLGSVGFVGMALGATFGGLLADKLGRRYIFSLTLLIYGLATGASALSTSLGLLLVFRFLVGLGLGAELPVASTLISEFSPRSIRGRVVVALEAFWAVGWILAAVIGTFVVPQANGWRWALAIGLIPCHLFAGGPHRNPRVRTIPGVRRQA